MERRDPKAWSFQFVRFLQVLAPNNHNHPIFPAVPYPTSIASLFVTPTFLCHAVHHRAKHQDISAAICASSKSAVTAQTCRANRRKAKAILIPGHSSTSQS